MNNDSFSSFEFSKIALHHLSQLIEPNHAALKRVGERLVQDVEQGKSLFVFGSGHSSLFTMELYHRAGGASFVVPLFADYLMPSAGPPVVRVFERTPGVANLLLSRAQVRQGEMLWLCSQSGINGAIVDLALDAKRRGLFTVAFTSRTHSASVASRHPSQKRLFEVVDEVIDLGGVPGDAAVEISDQVRAGPLSTLSAVFLAHSVLVEVERELEKKGISCTYTSVNTPEGEKRNRKIEAIAAQRDPLLRE